MRNRNSLLYRLLFVVAIVIFQLSVGYGQSCFDNACNVRLKFTGGSVVSNKIQICSGDSTLLTIDTSACSGANFSGLTFQWQFKDGNTWKDVTINRNKNNDSIYVSLAFQYRLIVSKISPGCSTTIDKFLSGGNEYPVEITLSPLPNITISPSSATVCANSSTGARLIVTGAGTDGTYSWSPAGGLNSTTNDTVFAKPNSLTRYTVIGTTAAGCRNSDNIDVSVAQPPNIDFSTDIGAGGCASNRTVKFNASCISGNCNNLSYSWDFGDPGSGSSNTSTNNDPSHKFTNANTSYTVRLIVTNGSGCRDTVQKTISIGAVPDVTITDGINPFNPFKICASGAFLIKIVNRSTTKSTNTSYTVEWGDGSPNYSGPTFGTNDTLSHVYPSLGFYNLKVTISNASGCTSSLTQRIFIGSNPAVGLSTDGSTVGLCVPYTLTFIIDTARTNKNSPGTTYTVSYNDGSPNDVFTHPAPPTFTHTFTNSSCGATKGKTPNTFFVSIRAENPCGFSDATVEPITTITKPEANFGISPSTVVCKGTQVTFTDSTLNGIYVDNFGNCIKDYDLFWTISPGINGIDYVVNSGGLGEVPTPSGTSPVGVIFNTAGSYNITLLVRTRIPSSELCNLDTITKTICVQDPPVAGFVATPLKGCNPLTISTDNISTPAVFCGPMTNRWVVTKTGGDCIQDSARNYTYTSGTDSTSFEPTIRLNNQGTYSVQLFLKNACPEVQSPLQTFTVIRKPEVTLTAPNAVCSGTPVTPSVTVKNCLDTVPERHFWTFQNGTPATSNSSNPGTITFPLNNGSTPVSYLIKDSVVNGCGFMVVSKTIIINPLPTISGTLNVCVGRTTALSGSGTPATTGAWTSSNPTVASVSGTGVVSGNAPGTADITYTDNNGCKRTVTITVNPNPAVTVSASVPAICDGQSTATLTASGANTYSWSSNPGTFSSTAASVTVNPTVTTTYTVTGTTTSTGCFSSAPVTITVNPLPTITGAQSVCVGNTIQLTGTANASSTNPWVSANPSIVSVTASTNIATVRGVSPGTTAITYTNSNGCQSTYNITVNPLPTVTVTASLPTICSGGSTVLTVSGANSYSWTPPTGLSATSGNPVTATLTNSTTAPTTATYTVTGVLSSTNCSNTATINITINPLPSAPTVANVTYCQGDTPSPLSVTTSSGNTLLWYTTSTGGTGSAIAPTPTTSAAGTTIYYVSQVNSTTLCEGARAPINVLVKPKPSITGTPNNPTSCGSTTGSILISGLTTSTAYTINYFYNGIAVTPINFTTSSTATTYTISGLRSGTYSNITFTLNACPSNPIGPFTLSDPNPPATPVATTSTSPICSGETIRLDANTSSSGTASWSWAGPNNFSSNIKNPSILNAGTLASGTYTVAVTIANCTSAAGTIDVIVNPKPSTPVVSNNGPLCTDSTLKFTASTASTIPVTWSWSGPNSFTSALQNPIINNITAAAAGTYTVTATATQGNCQSSNTTTLGINVTPSITNTSFTTPTSCKASDGTITLNGLLPNTNYQVKYFKNGQPVIINITSNSSGSVVIGNLSAGLYTDISVVLSGCSSNKIASIALVDPNPPVTPTLTANGPLCSGDNLNLTANTSSNGSATWNWIGPNGFTSTAQNPVITGITIAGSGKYQATVTIKNCTSAVGEVDVIVKESPAKPVINSNSPVCTEKDINLTASTTSTMPVTWSWSGPNSFTSSLQNPTINNVTAAAAGTYTATVTAAYTSPALSCSSSNSTPVVINITPSITATAFSPSTCATSTGRIIISGLTTGSIYIVRYVRNGTLQTLLNQTAISPGQITISNLASGTYTDIEVILNGCSSNKVGPFTLDDPTPPVLTIPSADIVLCANDPTGNITFSATPAGTTINWTNTNTTIGISSPGSGSINSFTALNTTPVQQIATLSISATLNGCTSAPQTMKIIVNPRPKIADITDVICSEGTFSVTPSSIVAGNIIPLNTTYTWTVADNPNVTGETAQSTGQSIITGTLINTSNTQQQVVYTVTPRSGVSGNCVGASFNVTVTINPKPIIANITQTICSDGTYDITPSNGGGNIVPSGTKYSWSAPTFSNAGAITVTSGSTGVDLLSISGQLKNTTTDQQWAEFTVTPKGVPGDCPGAPFKVRIIVNPRPTIQNITDAICSEGSFNITPDPNGANNVIPANTTYTWTFTDNPNVTGEASQSTGQSIITGTLTNTTNTVQSVVYTVTPRSGAVGNCPGVPFTLTINVNPKPFVRDTTLTICTGTAFAYTPVNGNGSIVPANTGYTWTFTDNPNVTGELNQTTATGIITGTLRNNTVNVQTVVYTVTPVSGTCTGNSFTVTVNVNPAPSVTFTPTDQTICSGEQTQSVTITSPTPGVSIPWTASVPSGISGVATGGSGTISVQTLINNTPNPITITYTATAQTSGTATCSGSPSPYTITVNPKPVIANITQEICSDSFFTVTPSTAVVGNIIPAGTTYSWTAPVLTVPGTVTGGRSGTAQALISDTLINLTNQVQTLTYTIIPRSGIADSCQGNPFTVTVTVYPVPKIPTLYDTICTGETFSAIPLNGAPNAATIVPSGTRYTWSAPSTPSGIGGAVGGFGQSSISGILTNTTFVPETIEYTVTPISGIAGSCQGNPFKVVITINPKSAISNNPLSQSLCTDNTTTSVNWTSFTPNSSFAWNLVSSGNITGFVSSGQGPTLPSMTLKNAGVDVDSVVYAVSSTAVACAAPATNYTIYVNPDAKAQINAPKDTACWPYAIPLQNLSPATANGNYNWYANNSLIGSGVLFPGYTIQNPDDSITIKLVAISKYGCKSDSVSKKFYTYKKPDVSFNPSTVRECGPLKVYFTNTSTQHPGFKYEWNFGNGQKSNLYQPDSVYFVTNPNYGDTIYNVTLKAFNQCDTVTLTQQVVVQSKPLSRFLPDKTTGCSPLKVVFNNTSLGLGNTYIWDFGDGSPRVPTSVKDTISHTYFVGIKTTFVVKLIAINPCGSDSSTFNLVVTPNPIKLDFAVLGTEQNGCAPHTVKFFNNTSGADNFSWDFGDGNILSTKKNVDTIIHTFLSPGKYTVKLFASSICSDTTATEVIDVFGKPAPAFTASTFSSCIGDSIRFTNQTTNGATSYLWNFGDGNTSVLVNPVHKYAKSGTYNVTLVAYKDNAPGVVCIDSIKTLVKIVDTLPVNFDISATLGKCTPFKVTFTNTFLNYSFLEWDFGDGAKGTGNVTEHTYVKNGIYDVRLTIRTIGGCTYTAVKQVTVAAPEGTVRIQTGFNCEDDNVRFEAVPVNTDSVYWQFGDGSSLTTKDLVVFHKYLNPGTYYASTEFISNDGCRFKVPGIYEIKIDRIVTGFKVEQDELCGTTRVRFVDTSNVFFGKASVEWKFGDGNSGIGTNVTHTYPSSGTYLVQQLIKSNSGCTKMIEIPVQVFVRSLPTAEIINAPVICTNTDIAFSSVVTSTDPVNFYKWKFSNGINSDKDKVTIRFANAGNINVEFIAGTIYGCYDTVKTILKVNQTPTVRAVPDVTICKGQSVNLNATGALNYSWFPTDYLSNPNIANPVSKPDVSTPYTVKGMTAEGCFAYDTININVVQPFKIAVMRGDSICIGESIRLLASGAYRYEWTPASSLNQANIPNPLATPQATTNYRVVGYDEYGCFKDTGFVLIGVGLYPTVNLGPDVTLSTGTLLELKPQVSNGPIVNWIWTPSRDLSCIDCQNPKAYIRNNITYNVTATNQYGCSGEDDISIKVFCENTQVYIPNAFTPGAGNGFKNDFFYVQGKGIMKVKTMRVFNRWGEIVFEQMNIAPNDPSKGWDGRTKGVIQGPDVYGYVVEVLCDDGTPFFYKGNVTLLK